MMDCRTLTEKLHVNSYILLYGQSRCSLSSIHFQDRNQAAFYLLHLWPNCQHRQWEHTPVPELGGVHSTAEMTATATVTVKNCNRSHLLTSEQKKMATADIVLLFINLFACFQSCVAVND